MKSVDDFSRYEEALWKLPVSGRISFVSQSPCDDQVVTQRVLTEEEDAVWGIRSGALMIKLIVESDGDICSLKSRRITRKGSGPREVKTVRLLEPMAAHLAILLDLGPDEIRRLLPGHRFNPYFELLCRVMERIAHVQPSLHHWRTFRDGEAEKFVRHFNKLIKLVRKKGGGREVQNALDGWRRRMRARTASSREYIDQIFALYPDVFSIHLNLGYCMQGGVDTQTWTSPFTLRQVKAHLAQYDRFLREHYPVIGHLYWREYGLQSGYHFRVVYFVNCSIKSMNHRVMPLLEEHWRKHITKGWGRHYNSRSAQYSYFGADRLRAHEFRESARKALVHDLERHITQADFWAFHKEGGKCFGRGQAPVALLRAMTGGVRRG
ncbi:hypothetical protein [Variovorax sp. RO1]|uniref:hypothetical protein n=1 Tax=Variovorax sp. RO1 TaxID=2066034 RepID=UPI0011815692|nr:hypothetical protein [Variovorax sp. RO1]